VPRQIEAKVDALGLRLASFRHVRMQGIEAFRLRTGDYRVIYSFDVERNELFLFAVGHRKDVYDDIDN